MIESYVVQPGDGWFLIAAKLAPDVTSEQRAAFAMAIAVANGCTFSTVLHPGRILWFDTTTVPVPAPPALDFEREWERLVAGYDIAGLDALCRGIGHDPGVELRTFEGPVAITPAWCEANEDGDHIRNVDGRWILDRLHTGPIRLSVLDFALRGSFVDAQGVGGDGISTPQGINPTGVIEDCTFNGGGSTWVGLNFRHATEPDQIVYRRVNVSGYRVGLYIAGGVTAEYCYAHDLHYSDGSHNTAASIRARNVRMYRNRLADGNSAALSLYAETTPYTGISVEENVLSTPRAIYECNFPGDKPYNVPQPGETRRLVNNLFERGTISGRQRFTELAGNRLFDGTPI